MGGTQNRRDCPEIATMAAYSERGLGRDERAAVEGHLAGCAACRAELAAILRARAGDATRETAPGWGRWWSSMPVGLAIAGAIAIVVAIGLGRDYYHQETPPAEIAMLSRKSAPAAGELVQNAPNRKAVEEKAEERASMTASMVETHRAGRRESAKQAALPEPLASPPEIQGAGAENAQVAADQLAKPGRQQQAEAQPPAERGAASSAISGGMLAPWKPSTVSPLQQAPAAAPNMAFGRLKVGPPPSTLSSPASPSSYAAGGMNAAAPAQAQAPTIAKLWFHKTITSPDGSVRWEFGTGGLIERFVSTGMTSVRVPGVTADLTAGSAPSATVCWIVGRGGTILRTVDGTQWEKVNSPTSLDFTAVVAQGADAAIVTAQDSSRWATSDGGSTWRAQ